MPKTIAVSASQKNDLTSPEVKFSKEELTDIIQRLQKSGLFEKDPETLQKTIALIEHENFEFAAEIKEILDRLEATNKLIADSLKETVDTYTRIAVYGNSRLRRFEEIHEHEMADQNKFNN